MSAVFGTEVTARLFLPKGSADWSIGDDFLKKDKYDNVLLQAFALVDQEIVDVRRCFEETTHVFAFGRNAQSSILQVVLIMFLYDGCSGGEKNDKWLDVEKLRTEYKKNRVYENQVPLKVSIDELNVSGYLIKMGIENVNPSSKTCTVTLNFLLDQEI